MVYRSMLIALLGLSMTGCAVYGGYDYGYGYPAHQRHDYAADYYRVQPYPVYVAPRVYYRDDYRHDDRHYEGRRYDQRRYLPAPQPRLYGHDRRHDQGLDRHRQDPRAGHARPGWQGRHEQVEAQQQPRRDAQGRQTQRQEQARQGWQGRQEQAQSRGQQPRRDSQDARGEGRRQDGRSIQGRQAHRQDRPQQRAQQAQRDSQGARRNDRRDWQPRLD